MLCLLPAAQTKCGVFFFSSKIWVQRLTPTLCMHTYYHHMKVHLQETVVAISVTCLWSQFLHSHALSSSIRVFLQKLSRQFLSLLLFCMHVFCNVQFTSSSDNTPKHPFFTHSQCFLGINLACGSGWVDTDFVFVPLCEVNLWDVNVAEREREKSRHSETVLSILYHMFQEWMACMSCHKAQH